MFIACAEQRCNRQPIANRNMSILLMHCQKADRTLNFPVMTQQTAVFYRFQLLKYLFLHNAINFRHRKSTLDYWYQYQVLYAHCAGSKQYTILIMSFSAKLETLLICQQMAAKQITKVMAVLTVKLSFINHLSSSLPLSTPSIPPQWIFSHKYFCGIAVAAA